ncbi:hypothetical protein BU23DRAFT_638854, partial [Bimuria novae-zelandiae CBS 107.79]
MEQSLNRIHDRKYVTDLYSHFRGSARVSLNSLGQFGPYVRDPHQEAIQALQTAFSQEGCRRLLPSNFIPVILTNAELQLAIERSNLHKNDLIERLSPPPFLEIPAGALTCLHGRQRVEAARRSLLGEDQWWTVDLFVDTDNTDWQRMMAEEYTRSCQFTDGEIFVKIRLHAKSAAHFAERRWWAQLSKRKQDFLRSFLKHPICRSFDRLLFIPGIWRGMNIGVLDKVMALKCDEVGS